MDVYKQRRKERRKAGGEEKGEGRRVGPGVLFLNLPKKQWGV